MSWRALGRPRELRTAAAAEVPAVFAQDSTNAVMWFCCVNRDESIVTLYPRTADAHGGHVSLIASHQHRPVARAS
jgi:hypothetical protein